MLPLRVIHEPSLPEWICRDHRDDRDFTEVLCTDSCTYVLWRKVTVRSMLTTAHV